MLRVPPGLIDLIVWVTGNVMGKIITLMESDSGTRQFFGKEVLFSEGATLPMSLSFDLTLGFQ